jgi:LAO/AO transport system kinase
MDAFHEEIRRFRQTETAAGRLAGRRRRQAEAWMTERLEAGLRERFGSNPGVRAALPGIVEDVREGRVAASVAARRLLDLMDHGPGV